MPSAHVHVTRYGKMSPTMRLTDATAATTASTSSTSKRSASLARRQVRTPAPTSTTNDTGIGDLPLRSSAPL